MANLTLCLNLGALAPTQFSNYDFKSFARFGGRVLAAGENGIFAIDETSNDDGVPIDAWFELPNSDLGLSTLKRIMQVTLDYESDGDLRLIVTTDGAIVSSYTIGRILQNIVSRGLAVPLFEDRLGIRYTFRFRNIAGCDFAVDRLTAFVNVLSRREISRNAFGVIMLKISTLDVEVSGSD